MTAKTFEPTSTRDQSQLPAPTPAHTKRRKHRAPGMVPATPAAVIQAATGFEVPVPNSEKVIQSAWRFGE